MKSAANEITAKTEFDNSRNLIVHALKRQTSKIECYFLFKELRAKY